MTKQETLPGIARKLETMGILFEGNLLKLPFFDAEILKWIMKNLVLTKFASL